MRNLVLLLLLIVLSLGSYAQKSRIKFNKISLAEGLSQSTVTSIVQDNKGFMWFGTLDGLNKYDGYVITSYRYVQNDPTSIPDNAISTILIDSKQNMWVGTLSGGLSRYDKIHDKFVNFKHIAIDSKSLSNNNIRAIFEDSKGTIWLGTAGGLVEMKTENGKPVFVSYEQPHISKSDVNKLRINQIVEDELGNLWLATENGLSKFNINTKKFSYFKHKIAKSNSLSNNSVNTVLIDDSSNIWAGTDYGLNKMNRDGTFSVYLPDAENQYSISDFSITTILSDDGILWIGTENGGLNKFYKSEVRFESYLYDPADSKSLSVNHVKSLFKDKANILWVGTSLGGICKWNRAAEYLDIFRHNPYEEFSLSSNQVRSIFQDKDSVIWIGTVDGGLNRWETKHNKFTHFKHDVLNYATISNDHIRAIYEDAKSNFWVGTDGGGLNLFDRTTKKARHFRYDEFNPKSISSDRVWSIYEDKNQNLWIGTYGGGLNRFDVEKNSFEAFIHDSTDSNSISDNRITTIFEDSHGHLWIGTYGGGLNLFDVEAGKFKHYRYDKNNSNSIGSDRVYSIYEDSDGTIWVGTKGSLCRFMPDTDNFVQYDEAKGFPNDVIMGILEDEEKNLWISTNQGVAKFSTIADSVVRNYDVRDGLQSNEFLVGAYCKSFDGEMFFGGINGFNAFFSENIKPNPHIPAIVITGFQLFNREFMLDTVICEKRLIKLDHNKNFISFNFVALDYIFPEKNQYAYRLVGYEKNWNFVKNRRFAIYTDLPPNKYVFKVIGSNNDEKWNEIGTDLVIIIEPAFWQTAWFKVISGLIIALSIFVYFRMRIIRVKKQNERLEYLVKVRTTEIRQKNVVLRKQKDDIEEKNIELEQQKEEIETQRDEIETQRDEITGQRDHISDQKKEITDSIVYARRIQKATLPSRDYISTLSADHFVLFKPKDIVSGDFFWAGEKDGKLIFVAADCTGHGVPGAFMSMFGVSFLNKIVNEKGITDPAKILNSLRDNIIKSLHQTGSEGEARDGMDISLCVLDRNRSKLFFAGANNPLYFVRNGEATIIKGDKMPIAIYDVMDSFTTKEIEIQQNDVFYIFSDGYADQFGGPRGKKFKYKPFRKLLEDISGMPLNEQYDILKSTLKSWKGNLDQVDDIVVFGVRI